MVMIALEKYATLCPDLVDRNSRRMVSGLLMTLPPKQAMKLMDKYDENRDGCFQVDEIYGMIRDVNHEYLDKKKMAKANVTKQAAALHEKHAKKLAGTHEQEEQEAPVKIPEQEWTLGNLRAEGKLRVVE
jgi:hypothetical protein